MKGIGRTAAIAAVLLPMAGAPLAAQSWRGDLGVNGGASWYSPMLTGTQIPDALGDVRFQGGWLTGAQAGFWFNPMIGIRANLSYTDRALKQGNTFMSSDTRLARDVNLWSGTGDLLFRLRRPSSTFKRFDTTPYIAAGLGTKWISPAGNSNYAVIDQASGNTYVGVPIGCAGGVCGGLGTPFGSLGVTGTPGAVGENTGSNAAIPGLTDFIMPSQHVLMGLAGVGADVRLAPRLALRVEAGDRIYKPRIYQVSPGTTVPGGDAETTNGTTNVGKTVHELYAQAGLHVLVGLAAPPVVAIQPAPAPPAPAAAPAPAAPATEQVNVCVVDPMAANGLRTVTATYDPATNDTTVTMNGRSMSLSASVGTVPVASNADWYLQGKPLTIGTGHNTLDYVSSGSARTIDTDDLTFVGTVNGMPLYANKDAAGSLTIPAQPGDIASNATLLSQLRNVQVLYAPLASTGCDFQALQLQQQVQKVRG